MIEYQCPQFWQYDRIGMSAAALTTSKWTCPSGDEHGLEGARRSHFTPAMRFLSRALPAG